jgi:formyltetrahydrofolate synthetase
VVAVNRFDGDHPEELDVIDRSAKEAGAEDTLESRMWSEGGAGGEALARAVVRAAEKPSEFRFLYPLEWPIEKKIETIVLKIYGAEAVEYAPKADQQIKRYEELGWSALPICMAKTHLSLSADPKIKGRPFGFRMLVREIRASIGAGFLYPILGDMTTMPGLPSHPGGERFDIDEYGRITGLS